MVVEGIKLLKSQSPTDYWAKRSISEETPFRFSCVAWSNLQLNSVSLTLKLFV